MKLLSALALACAPFLASAADLPNILILYADDMGYGDLSANVGPSSKVPTPNLDQLAAEGMRFTDGHSSSANCSPSRYAMLTGRHHWRKFYGIVNAFEDCVIGVEELTLPDMLREKGYSTAAIGKWHLGWGWDRIAINETLRIEGPSGRLGRSYEAYDWSKPVPNGPTAHGFDYYFGDDVINYPPYTWIENDRILDIPDRMHDPANWPPPPLGSWGARPGPLAPSWNPRENIVRTTEKAIEFIQAQAKTEEPFFLYFAFPSPHAPIIPRDEFLGKSEAGPHGDYVYETDHVSGVLLEALKASGQADNTIVLFTTDNGTESIGYKVDDAYDHWASGPYRGLKRDIYEGGHRLPFIVKWPGVIKPGSVSDALVSQIDLMATFAAIAGYELADGQAEDSYDMLPVWRGEKMTLRDTYIHNMRDDGWAVRQGDWVLVHAEGVTTQVRERAKQSWYDKHGYPTAEKSARELYNLSDDPGQRQNLSAKYPEKVEAIISLLHQIRDEGYPNLRYIKKTE